MIAQTARRRAAARARESRRPERLFEDPWAEVLERGWAVESGTTSGEAPDDGDASVIVSTRFFDDFLLHATSNIALRQVVLTAAGGDTRAFRLVWAPGVRIYELDRPDVLELKDRVLSDDGARPGCERRTLAVDLTHGWTGKLQEAGFRPDAPTAWLVEGFFVYLEEDDVRSVLRQLSDLSVPGSRLAFDVPNRAFFTSEWTRPVVEGFERLGAPYRFGTDEPEALLAEFGWAAEVTTLGHEGAKYGRWPYPTAPRSAARMPHGLLVTATRLS